MKVGPGVCICDHHWLKDHAPKLPEVIDPVGDYAPGAERDFIAVVKIVDGDDTAAVEEATAAAGREHDEWGEKCPKMVAAFTWRSGYEVYEVPGDGWYVRYTHGIRLYTLEESTTLPGDWSRQQEEGK